MNLMGIPDISTWSGDLRRLDDIRRGMERLFAEADRPRSGRLAAGVFPAINVSETDDAVLVRAELPGVDADELDITVENGTLTIAGERSGPSGDQRGGVHRRERPWGAFRRSFALPIRVDSERVEARYVDGILTVTLPKAAESRPRRIAVGTDR